MKDFLHSIVNIDVKSTLGIFAGLGAALLAYFNTLLAPLMVLIVVMLLDYLTGMISAGKNKQINSRVGVLGIVKKAGYLALVAVGMVVDYLISSALVTIGISLQINYCFGMIITIWLIINELISILENLGEMNIPLPEFLIKTIKSLKNRVEDAADEKDGD